VARTTIGSLEAVKDAVRDVGWESQLESIWQDVRHSFRGLRRSPGFAAVAILTLALGTGSNTAIFTLIDALLLRSLPVDAPEQLVQLTMVLPTGATWQSFSYPLVRGLADRRDIFTSLAGFSGALFDVGPPEAMEITSGEWVTGRYYETLGVRAAAGRLLTADDDQPGVSPVVVLSDSYWRRKFGRDPQVIGQRLTIGRSTATIVGVSQAGFEGATVGEAADLTLPIGVLPQVAPERAEGLEASSTWLRVLARPRDGMSAIQAKTLLATAWPAVATSAIPADIPIALRRALVSTVDAVPGATGWSPLRDQFRRPLLVLMAFVAVVLLIACVNVANLLLARTASRRGEITVRLAIGGRRSRIVRQLLTENAVLAFWVRAWDCSSRKRVPPARVVALQRTGAGDRAQPDSQWPGARIHERGRDGHESCLRSRPAVRELRAHARRRAHEERQPCPGRWKAAGAGAHQCANSAVHRAAGRRRTPRDDVEQSSNL
jgi:predicted permease